MNTSLNHRTVALLVLSPIVTPNRMTPRCWIVREMDFGADFEWMSPTLFFFSSFVFALNGVITAWG